MVLKACVLCNIDGDSKVAEQHTELAAVNIVGLLESKTEV